MEPPESVPPWQYVEAQVAEARFQAGAAPPEFAREPKITGGGVVAVEWVVSLGTTWHSLQAMAPRSGPALRCDWWAPTPRAVVDVLPCASLGGAGAMTALARVESPWQDVQAVPLTSTVPLMCLPPATSIVPSANTVPGWHPAHAVVPPETVG